MAPISHTCIQHIRNFVKYGAAPENTIVYYFNLKVIHALPGNYWVLAKYAGVLIYRFSREHGRSIFDTYI